MERDEQREAFWASLLPRARERTSLHAGVSPGTDHWLRAGSGRRGVHFTYGIRRHDARVLLTVEGEDEEVNHEIFDALVQQREEIEQAFGGTLDWSKVEGRKRCQIGVTLPAGGYNDDKGRWPETQQAMIDAMVRLERAFKPLMPNLGA